MAAPGADAMTEPKRSDSPPPFGPVAGEERWLASDRTLTAVWAVLCVALAIPQWWWWPVTGGSRLSWWLLGLTALVAAFPYMAYLGIKGDSVFPRWAAAHGFRFDASPQWRPPNWGVQPFNTAQGPDLRARNALDGDVNGFPATYINLSGKKLTSQYRYVFVLQLPRPLPYLTLAAKIAVDRNDDVGYAETEPVRPFYRYGADPQCVRSVFGPTIIDTVLSTLPKAMRKDIRFDAAGTFLVAATPRAFRAEEITAVFLAMHAIAAGIPSTAWLSD